MIKQWLQLLNTTDPAVVSALYDVKRDKITVARVLIGIFPMFQDVELADIPRVQQQQQNCLFKSEGSKMHNVACNNQQLEQ